MRHGSSQEAERRAKQKFEQTRIKQISLKLNDRTDADIIAHLEGIDNNRAYILGLIRKDMNAIKTQ